MKETKYKGHVIKTDGKDGTAIMITKSDKVLYTNYLKGYSEKDALSYARFLINHELSEKGVVGVN